MKFKSKEDMLKAYKSTFSSSAGQQVLEDLERLFAGENDVYYSGIDSLELAVRAAKRDVINYIKRVINTEIKGD